MKTQIKSRMNRVHVDSRQKNDAAGQNSELEVIMIREAVKRTLNSFYREIEDKLTAQINEEARAFRKNLVAIISSVYHEIFEEIDVHAECRIEQFLSRYEKNKSKIDNSVRADCEYVFLRVAAIIKKWRNEITMEMEERKRNDLQYIEDQIIVEKANAEGSIRAEISDQVNSMNDRLNKLFTGEEVLDAYFLMRTKKIEKVPAHEWPSPSILESKERGFKRTVYHKIRNELSFPSFEKILVSAEKGNRWKDFAELANVM